MRRALISTRRALGIRWASNTPASRINEIEAKVLEHFSKTAASKKEMDIRKFDLIQVDKELEELKLRGGLTPENLQQINQIQSSTSVLSSEVDFQVSEFHSYTAHILEIVIIFCILLEAYIAYAHH